MPDLTVVYESGVFKPILPLSFPEGQQFQIRILDSSASTILEFALQALVAIGALTNPTVGLDRLPEVSLEALPEIEFEEYGVAMTTAISDCIIEDRGSL
jgi:predicted DNA-binding antitoxin AbrB/MazE fold protein